MSEDVVAEARALLEPITSDWSIFAIADYYANTDEPETKQGVADARFIDAAPRLVRGLLAEVDRLRAGGSMASATRKDAASQVTEPVTVNAFIDPPALEPRCRCTHRWAEHYGTKSKEHPERGCQRACGCLVYQEAHD